MIKVYRERRFIQAVEFINTAVNIQEVIDFIDLPISIEYTSAGVQLRIIRSPYNVIIAKVGEYITKDTTGTLGVRTLEALQDNYDEVTE